MTTRAAQLFEMMKQYHVVTDTKIKASQLDGKPYNKDSVWLRGDKFQVLSDDGKEAVIQYAKGARGKFTITSKSLKLLKKSSVDG